VTVTGHSHGGRISVAVHQHQHDGEHVHDHAEGGWEPSRPGSVMLDIGPDRGALVVMLPAGMLGLEIEAEPCEGDWAPPFVHTAVRERLLPGGSVFAAVFQSLPPGSYRLWQRGGGPALAVASVSGGKVAEIDLTS
jgi:hypothetical protein